MLGCFGCCISSVHLGLENDHEILLEPHQATQYIPALSPSSISPTRLPATRFWDKIARLFYRPTPIRLHDDISEARPFFVPGFDDREGNCI